MRINQPSLSLSLSAQSKCDDEIEIKWSGASFEGSVLESCPHLTLSIRLALVQCNNMNLYFRYMLRNKIIIMKKYMIHSDLGRGGYEFIRAKFSFFLLRPLEL